MTVLLELKQKIKSFYSEHDVLLLSLLKFLLGFLLFHRSLLCRWNGSSRICRSFDFVAAYAIFEIYITG